MKDNNINRFRAIIFILFSIYYLVNYIITLYYQTAFSDEVNHDISKIFCLHFMCGSPITFESVFFLVFFPLSPILLIYAINKRILISLLVISGIFYFSFQDFIAVKIWYDGCLDGSNKPNLCRWGGPGPKIGPWFTYTIIPFVSLGILLLLALYKISLGIRKGNA